MILSYFSSTVAQREKYSIISFCFFRHSSNTAKADYVASCLACGRGICLDKSVNYILGGDKFCAKLSHFNKSTFYITRIQIYSATSVNDYVYLKTKFYSISD